MDYIQRLGGGNCWKRNGAQIPHLPLAGELARGHEIISEVPPRETYRFNGMDRGLFELRFFVAMMRGVIHLSHTYTPIRIRIMSTSNPP